MFYPVIEAGIEGAHEDNTMRLTKAVIDVVLEELKEKIEQRNEILKELPLPEKQWLEEVEGVYNKAKADLDKAEENYEKALEDNGYIRYFRKNQLLAKAKARLVMEHQNIDPKDVADWIDRTWTAIKDAGKNR